MKNSRHARYMNVFWSILAITGVIAYFNFGLAGYLFFPLLILFIWGNWLMKKKHISSIENIMFAGYRLLFL